MNGTGWAWRLGVALLGVCAWCAGVRAAEPLPVVLRLSAPDDVALAERVRGQTSDLLVSLDTVSVEGDLEGELGAQLSAARELSASHGARVVVWFTREEQALTVLVAEPARGRLFARRIDVSDGALAQSAQQEAAALVVRTALRALSEGGEIGVSQELLAPAPAPAPQEAPNDAPVPSAVPPVPAPRSWRVLSALGARASLDGASEHGAYGLTGRLGFAWQRVRIETRGDVGIYGEAEVARAALELARHAVSAHLVWRALRNELLELSFAAGVGAAFYRGRVHEPGADFRPTAPRASVAVTHAEISFARWPRWARGRFGWSTSLGADFYPRVPVLGYHDAGGSFVRAKPLWHVQPTVSLEAILSWP